VLFTECGGAAVVILERPVVVDTVFAPAPRGGELAFQAHFAPPPEPVCEEPQQEPVRERDPRQLQFFAWWKEGWPGKDGRKRPAKRRPIRGWTGYAKALACYFKYLDATSGCLTGMQRKNVFPETLQGALAIIRERRRSLVLCSWWWRGDPAKELRPEGCHDERLCTMCGPAAAAGLARDAVSFVYEEFTEAAKVRVMLERNGEGWELALHRDLSEALELELVLGNKDRWREEVNRVGREAWSVIQGGHPEGVIGGYQSVQLYGEGDPGKPHYHFHNVVAPVVVGAFSGNTAGKHRVASHQEWPPRDYCKCGAERAATPKRGKRGQPLKAMGSHGPWFRFGREDKRCPGEPRGDRQAILDGVKPLARWITEDVLADMRRAWAKCQNDLAKRLGVADWQPLAESGDGKQSNLHRSYFKLGERGMRRAKWYLNYQSRWPGQDLASGLKPDGKYTWTGAKNETPSPERFGPWAKFTGKWTTENQPIYERELEPDDAVRAVWRLEAVPENWPRLRWMGCLSTGRRKKVMQALGWREEKVVLESDDEGSDERWKPVGRAEDGLIFESEGGDRQILVPWDRLVLSPVDSDGRSLVKRRKKRWVGPG